jgi:hypothetical protein
MKYTTEMGAVAMDIYEDSFRHSKVCRGRRDSQTQHGDCISLHTCFQIKESRLKSQ